MGGTTLLFGFSKVETTRGGHLRAEKGFFPKTGGALKEFQKSSRGACV